MISNEDFLSFIKDHPMVVQIGDIISLQMHTEKSKFFFKVTSLQIQSPKEAF